ncbi:MAG TPA: TetR/AcrR family transcriptional regulator [Pseudomonadales bacterium]
MAVKKSHETSLTAKGEQARRKLKKAALVVLERVGYHKMRITDVTAEAGVAAGLFYHYFKDLKSLTVEVLGDFVAGSRDLEAIEKDVPRGDWYGRIYAHNLFIVRSYAKHPGVMRCLFQLADEDEDFSRLIRANFVEQLMWLVRQMPRLFPEAALTPQQALLVVYTLAASGEVLLRDYYISRDPVLTAEPLDTGQLAELLSVVFYRGLFLANPPAEKMRYTQGLQYLVRSTGSAEQAARPGDQQPSTQEADDDSRRNKSV